MPMKFLLTAAAVVMASACAPSINVTTDVAPDAAFSNLRTFRIMTPPTRADGRTLPANDPMLVNSITNQALQSSIAEGFRARGYRPDDSAPDFTIAYYATARERLDVTLWNYGYPGRWGGWRGGPEYVATPYTQGTVIIDIVNPKSKELLWRGRGQAATSDDPVEFQKSVRETVQAIIRKFPGSPNRVAAGHSG
jgi:hypothetical protein